MVSSTKERPAPPAKKEQQNKGGNAASSDKSPAQPKKERIRKPKLPDIDFVKAVYLPEVKSFADLARVLSMTSAAVSTRYKSLKFGDADAKAGEAPAGKYKNLKPILGGSRGPDKEVEDLIATLNLQAGLNPNGTPMSQEEKAAYEKSKQEAAAAAQNQ